VQQGGTHQTGTTDAMTLDPMSERQVPFESRHPFGELVAQY
jgi:hypothetical protein